VTVCSLSGATRTFVVCEGRRVIAASAVDPDARTARLSRAREQSAAAADSPKGQAARLAELVSQFRVA